MLQRGQLRQDAQDGGCSGDPHVAAVPIQRLRGVDLAVHELQCAQRAQRRHRARKVLLRVFAEQAARHGEMREVATSGHGVEAHADLVAWVRCEMQMAEVWQAGEQRLGGADELLVRGADGAHCVGARKVDGVERAVERQLEACKLAHVAHCDPGKVETAAGLRFRACMHGVHAGVELDGGLGEVEVGLVATV